MGDRLGTPDAVGILFLDIFTEDESAIKKVCASSGNRTRAARVAGEHSTTEPTMLRYRKGPEKELLS